ncbi:hypothetical protein [Streptomyces triculaminicus]|uniref:hypothetical protein n=1 Tax=Streptomyces triculaminicus TaxID=2816232 RepID=UPI0037D77134
MRTRHLVLGLYADEAALEWARSVIRSAAASHRARVVRWEERGFPERDASVEDLYDHLAEQWSYEHPGQEPTGHRPVELRLGLTCSLRQWRSLRKTVPRELCPEGSGPHICRVPWSLG